jgi:uncharacterized protein (TIGR03437 family)
MTNSMRRLLVVFAFAFLAHAQTPSVGGVVNAGDFSQRLCPGVTAAIYGANFGDGPASRVTVMVGGRPAHILLVTPSQLTVQLPDDAPTAASPLTVTVDNVQSQAVTINLDAFAPAFLSADGSGTGAGLFMTSAGAALGATTLAQPGDTLTGYAVGLGATNPGPPTSANPTSSAVSVSIGGVPATTVFAGSMPGMPGIYQVTFKVPAGVQGTLPVVLSVGGQSSNGSVTLALFGIAAIVSNASFGSAGTVAPGSIVSVFANGLGTANQQSGFPGTSFQGVSVSFNGTFAPLFHVTGSAGQIDLLVPFELPASGTVNVQLTTPSGVGPNYTLTMVPAAPGMYFLADPSTKGRFNMIAQFNNTAWLAMPASMAAALKIPGSCSALKRSPLSVCGQPATAGDYLVLYTTGLGKATPNGDPNGTTLKTGDIPPANGSVLYKTVATPTVTVGGIPVPVLFSGISPGFAGLYQINFQVPKGATGDDVPVTVSVGGSPTDTRTVSIH